MDQSSIVSVPPPDASSAEAPAVSVHKLKMGYGTRVLLDGASFDVARGEILVILGGSGCGKSSLMKNIIGLYQPMGGDILIAGESIISAGPKAKAQLQRKLGIMYQSGALFGSLTVLENVRFPLDEFTDIGLEEKNLTARLLLHQVEMAYAESLMPAELSGGMLKRAGIARAMALGADILMLDEPSAGLDPITAANLDRTILSLRDNLGFTFVVVTHELQSIFTIADRAGMLDPTSRTIIAEGKPCYLRDHSQGPRVRQFFNSFKGASAEWVSSGKLKPRSPEKPQHSMCPGRMVFFAHRRATDSTVGSRPLRRLEQVRWIMMVSSSGAICSRSSRNASMNPNGS